MTVKIEALIGNLSQPVEYDNVFAREDAAGYPRLRIGVSRSQDACLRALAKDLSGPFQLLYVLHTTRTGAELGRYESPMLTAHAVERFLDEFGRFLCEDSRHDVWVRSHDDDASIILDRHNLIFAYGPLDAFETVLQALGVRKGVPTLLGPHVHHYHTAWDNAEREVLRLFDWHITALRPSDVEFDTTVTIDGSWPSIAGYRPHSCASNQFGAICGRDEPAVVPYPMSRAVAFQMYA